MAERPLRADAQRNRDKVLRAARDAFAASGYGVPLDEIAARAGVGPGTVYRHFPSKEELFEAVIAARVTDLIDDARRRAGDADPGRAFLPAASLTPLTSYEVPVLTVLEDVPVKRVTIYRLT